MKPLPLLSAVLVASLVNHFLAGIILGALVYFAGCHAEITSEEDKSKPDL